MAASVRSPSLGDRSSMIRSDPGVRRAETDARPAAMGAPMSEMKTRPNETSVDEFLRSIPDPARREDCCRLLEIMQNATGEEPKIWGGSMVGFGTYHYRYDSGREGDWFLTGFSPRKTNLTLYIMAGFERYADLMDRLGTYRTGKSCLYVNRLVDVDETVLRELIGASVDHMERTYGAR
jgi:hypothetical protein